MIATSFAIPIGSGVREIETWSPMSADLASEFEYIDIAAIDREQKVITATARTRASDAPSRARQIVQKGDVLVSTVRPALNAVAVVPPSLDGAIASTGFTVLRSDERRLHGPYLFHWVRGTAFIDEMVRLATGASYPAVSDRIVKAASIPIPFPDDPRRSLAEQKRIATILDKADAIRRRRQEAARLADTLIPSVFYEMFGDPTFNRHKWPEMTMLEVTEKVTDGEHITPLRTSNGIKLLSARNVKNGFIDLDEDVDFVGPEEFERIRQRCDPRQGDVLISCSGTVGRVTTVRITEPFTLVRSVAMVRPNTSIVNADYLEYYLRTEHAQRHINRSANKSSQANIFLGPIKKLPILVPPIERQRDFLAKAEQCRTLAARMADATRLADDGFNSFVQRAFRGEL